MGLKSQFEGGNMGNKGEIFFRININITIMLASLK